MDIGSAPEYYPVSGSYYYYPTEPVVGMGEHQSTSDLQEMYYQTTGPQNENMQYAYVAPPGYGYSQSPYNPYNPYIPSAIVGTDSQFSGTQQYLTNPSYEQLASTAYVPAAIQPSSDTVMSNSAAPYLNIGMASTGYGTDSVGTQHIPFVPANSSATYQSVAVGQPLLEPSKLSTHQIQNYGNLPNGALCYQAESNQYLSHGSMAAGNVSHVSQNYFDSIPATNNFGNVRVSSGYGPYSGSTPANTGFTNSVPTIPRWNPVDHYMPSLQYQKVLTNGRRIPNILGDQHRGPRSKGFSDGTVSAIAVQASNQSGNINVIGNILKHANQYNGDGFLIDYPIAKFFVIKSYTEDDVHKSIKYNVWSSTPYGNKKLDNAFEDAQRISAGRQRSCPVFLFFSVNASGRFCGVAEMTGQVDFCKNMDFWNQDKWVGSFPVKWHIIKDVPNTSLRHILLENNEFTPVTSSRDTQEVTYIPGMGMLEIFKHHICISSLLDDFMYYEGREREMQEQRRQRKSQQLGRNPAAALYFPVRVVHPPAAHVPQPQAKVVGLPKKDGQPNGEVLGSSKDARPQEQSDGVLPNDSSAAKQHSNDSRDTSDQPSKLNKTQATGSAKVPPKADGKRPGYEVDQQRNAHGSKTNQNPKHVTFNLSGGNGVTEPCPVATTIGSDNVGKVVSQEDAVDSDILFTVGTVTIKANSKSGFNSKRFPDKRA